MSAYTATFFLGMKAHFRGNTSVHPVFYVEPDGEHRPGYLTFQLDSKLSVDEQLEIADRFATAVTAWRDEIAARADQQRTATDELNAARAEIARLKAEAVRDA
ncbi:hypothetical protein OOK39_02330 [Streptomyces sp. NBC_00264]|uniref:hypothetical protein n=1 Tax=unclassified Streptomyces TaxID=2593676 RepID=UPI00224CF2DF|nr:MULTISPECIES: hypothetical protein [unclassified Streptomyces]MCX5158138.1 hypothetical protein [Streptomyces sp. NBC_00305]MCX5216661.1 hypothetical protein [Streptomyces sp. NBC_00264]